MPDGLAILVNSFLRGEVLPQRVYVALSIRRLLSSILGAGATSEKPVLQHVDSVVEIIPDLDKLILGFLILEFPLVVGFSKSLSYLVQPLLSLGR